MLPEILPLSEFPFPKRMAVCQSGTMHQPYRRCLNALTSNWAWGLSLIALSLGMHAVGLVGIGLILARIENRLGAQSLRRAGELAGGALIIGMAGLMLAILHGIEAALWGAVYLFVGAVDVYSDAILYSVDSISTRGASGLNLQQHWEMMGALEAVDGMLLFGISTAFLFTVLARLRHRLAPVPGTSHR
jgi:hypothetical protein